MFKDLRTFIPLAFSCDAAALSAAYFGKDYLKGGIFFYDATEEQAIPRTHFRGKTGVQKYMTMVAYLFELRYDLALGAENVSKSPGFEACGLTNPQR